MSFFRYEVKLFALFVLFSISLSTVIKTNKKEVEKYTQNSDQIVVLNESNYQSSLGKYENILILFYSPYCKYSKLLLDELVKVNEFKKSFGYHFTIAQVNTSTEMDLTRKLKIEGTPSLRFIKKEVYISEFETERSAPYVLRYVVKELGFNSVNISKVSQLDLFKSFSKNSLIFVGNKNTVLLDLFNESISIIKDEIIFGNIILDCDKTDEELKNNLKEYHNSIVLLRKPENESESEYIKYNSNEDVKELSAFVSSNIYSDILDFNEKTLKLVFSLNKPGLFFYVSPKHREEHRELIKQIPSEVRKHFVTYLLGSEENEPFEGRLYSLVNVTPSDFPSVKIHQVIGTLNTETMKKEINVENIIEFISKWNKHGFTQSPTFKDDL